MGSFRKAAVPESNPSFSNSSATSAMSKATKVFFDGRYKTVYGDDFVKDYFDVLYGKKDYRDYLARFPETDVMFLNRINPLARKLAEDKEWMLVYPSSQAWIFLKDNRKNSRIIEGFKKGRLIYNDTRGPFYLS